MQEHGRGSLTRAGVLVALLGACGAGAADRPGAIDVALVTTAPDGTVYRLTAGARLELFGGSYFDSFSLDGDGPLVSINVPPGDYFASLVHPSGYTDVWPIERTRPDGTVDVVNAVLATPMPAALTVPDGFSVSLELSFHLAGGIITFAQGTIDISVGVTQVGATGARVDASAALSVDSAVFGVTGPPLLATRLPGSGTTGLSVSMTGSLTGVWTVRSSRLVCNPIALSVSATGNPGFDDLVTEASGTTELCVLGGPEQPPFVIIRMMRTGLSSTPTFDFSAPELFFSMSVRGALPAPAYDGLTLDLDRLNGTFDLAGGGGATVMSTTSGDTWYSADLVGDVHITIVPLE
jgi:hypothetical protein